MSTYDSNKLRLASCFLLGALGALSVLVVAALAIWLLTGFSFLSNQSCGASRGIHFCLFDRDVWGSETYLSTISSFYGTIITLLVGVLALVGGFSFFAIRASAFERAEETIEKEVAHYLGETVTGQARVRDAVHETVASSLAQIKTRLDELEQVLDEAGLRDPGTLEVGDEEATK